jgi:glycosyltransferase involved in cell wall biosynthesis
MVKIFTECGVKVPVTQVRQGFNVDQYPFYERGTDRPVFTFALAGWLDTRKNWDDVVRAFSSEFAPDEPVRLILKNTCPAFGYMTPKDPRIKIVDRVFTPAEMTRFYQVIDCLVFTSRAEGSGLPAREAMATGLPVILTDWSGLSEVCDPNVNYPIKPISIDYPDTRPDQPGFMARLDVAEIMYWMRYVYEHQEEARQKGKKASQWMQKEWGWDACAEEMLDIIKKI